MENLKKCWERAELLLEVVRQRPNKMCVVSPNSGANQTSKWKSIHQKLAELYVEECSREPKRKHLRNASHLLDKLVARDKLGCLLVNLYPGNEGYSVMMKGRSGMDAETVRLPYEEAELLQYIDNEELPPVLVDILESSQVNIFYSGCVIAEVRDYRRSACPTIYESHHVLLRPSMQTLVCDVNALTSDSGKWSHEDKMALESQLILATQEPLCLEPSVTVALVANRQQHAKHAFAVHPIKQMAKKFSQTAINRKWKFERHPAPPDLRLCDFLTGYKERSKKGSAVATAASLRLGKMGVNLWKQREVKLTAPEEVNAMLYAMSIPPPHSSGNHLDFVEEYVLESKQGNGKGYYCRLSIQLRPLDDVYVGELYTDRDYVVGVPRGGSCWFEFRTRTDVDKYLHQFIDIFTQESRKVVKISHKVGDEDPVVRMLPGGQSIVFPLTSAASTALQLGELPSPVPKTAASASTTKRPASPTSVSSGETPATDTADALTASNRSTSTRPVSTVGQQRPSSDSPVPVSPTSQTRPPTNPIPQPLAPKVATPSPAPVAIAATQPVGLIGRLQSSLAGFLNNSGGGGGDVNELPGNATIAPVSLTTAPQGNIAVPISLAVVASNQPNLVTTPIIVGQMSNLASGLGAPVSSSATQTIVCGGLTTTNSIPVSTSIVVSSGMLTSSVPSVLSAPTGVVSIPVGITGSLSSQNLAARIIASGIKNSNVGGQNPLGLIQVTGTQLTTGSIFAAGSPAQKPVATKIGISPTPTTASGSSTPPTAHSAKFGSTLMKFSGQPHLHFTLQQSQVASLQLQQLRQKQQDNGLSPQQTSTPAAPKGKSRKRKASTPPPK